MRRIFALLILLTNCNKRIDDYNSTKGLFFSKPPILVLDTLDKTSVPYISLYYNANPKTNRQSLSINSTDIPAKSSLDIQIFSNGKLQCSKMITKFADTPLLWTNTLEQSSTYIPGLLTLPWGKTFQIHYILKTKKEIEETEEIEEEIIEERSGNINIPPKF